jgi:ribosomal protein S6--L-glutamate ligase
MRLAILSRKASLYTTRRFAETAKRLGHNAIVIDPLQCMLRLDEGAPAIVHHGKQLEGLSAVLPRIGNSITEYGLAVVRQFELMKVVTVNSSMAINISRDKWRSVQLWKEHGIPMPATVLIRVPEDVRPAIEILGGLPVIVKMVQGTQGIGVMLAENLSSLESILETLWGLDQNILLQRYVKESEGRDLRVIVVGDKVVGAMRRTAKDGEFRANIHRGGIGESVELPPNYAATALRVMQTTGLQVGGVDMLETAAGPLVLEVNSSPGFEGIDKAIGCDVATVIVEHCFRLAEAGIQPT